jgi:hypothetical protein
MNKENKKILSCGCSIVECVFKKSAECMCSKEEHTKEMIETSPFIFKCTPPSKEDFEKTLTTLNKCNNAVIQIQENYTIAIPTEYRKIAKSEHRKGDPESALAGVSWE